MADDDQSGTKPAPVVLRIKLRYDDLDTFVERFAANIGRTGLFVHSKTPRPVATEVKFELRLSNDTPVLVGLGRVKHVKPPDPAHPKAAFGMAIELMRVSREGREVIIRMIERRRAMGLPDVAIPMPDDIESSRRSEVESHPRADTSGVMRDAMAQLTKPDGGALLTSPRPGSGPIAVARDTQSARIPVPVLAPEKSRPRRPAVQELIDKAAELSSRIVLPTPELDMHVDVESVLSRARALAGGDLDVELATLREAAAAPIEISVEAASAELARQLGGKPIGRREKSARWAPPPAIELKTPLADLDKNLPSLQPIETPREEFVAKTRAETELAPSAAIAEAVDTAVEAAADPPELRAESPSIVPKESYVIRQSAELVVQRDAEVDDDAFLQTASTTTAVEPEPSETTGVTSEQERISSSELGGDGLMIDDDADVSSFERALDAARVHTGVSAPAPERPDDDIDDPGEGLLASGEYSLDEPAASESTVISTSPLPRLEAPPIPDALAAQLDEQLAESEAEADRDMAELREEEISDLDVLAEADEEDEDLLNAHSQSYAQPDPAAYADHVPYETPPPDDDFASRLDLGEDEELPPAPDIDRDAAREFDEDVPQPIDDYSHAPQRDSYPEYREPPQDYGYQRARRASSEHSYTFAEDPAPQSIPHFTPHETGEEFDEPHGYAADPAPARGPDPRLLRHGRATTASTDLEDALAALDVGGIDLERRMRKPTPSASRPLPGLPIEKPRTGPVPIVQEPARTKLPTGQQPQMLAHPPAQQPAAQQPAPARAKSSTAKPPPIPAAARKPPTIQVPITKPPAQQAPVVKPARASTADDGVLIDFDDEE